MGTNIVDNLAVHATCISDDFLDKYLGTANGDYIKVYLYILRHRGEKYSVEAAADSLNLTDNDIERAVRYWEKLGVFKSAEGITASSDEEEIKDDFSEKDSEALEIEREFSKAEEKIARLEGTVDDIQDDEEFKVVLFVAKQMLPTLPSIKQIEALKYMYKDLKMSSDVIEYLIEYCASVQKTTHKYMMAVAINWHEQGVSTAKQARDLIKSIEENVEKKTSRNKTAVQPSFKPSKATTGYINFQQRTDNLDDLVLARVQNRMNHVVD